MTEDDEEPATLEVDVPGPDGHLVSVTARQTAGPTPCPFCPIMFSTFETATGRGLVAHPEPICSGFLALEAEDYVRAAQERDGGVNVRGRGAA